jgi:hypothetical protein
VGDLVRVRKGVVDPDFPDLPLGGWTGWVQEVEAEDEPPIYLIEWNTYTLNHLPEVYRVRCDREGLDEETIRLSEDELEPATGEQPPLEQPVNLVARPLRTGDQDDRIRAILGVTSDQPVPEVDQASLDKYFDYLVEKLSFPFNAHYWLADPETGRPHPLLATAYRLLPARRGNEGLGLVVEASLDDSGLPEDHVLLPLADLELLNDKPEMRRTLQDYASWFEEFGGEEGWPGEEEEQVDLEEMVMGAGRSSPWAFWMTMARLAIYGAGAGAVLGSILAAVAGAQTGLMVGALILGLAGFLFGTRSASGGGGQVPGARISPIVGGLTLGCVGTLLGGVIGPLVVAFMGTIPGSIAGSLLGGGLALLGWKPLKDFWWVVLGTLVGGLTLAFLTDRDRALDGALYGMGVGALLAVVLLLGFLVVMVFGMPRKQ